MKSASIITVGFSPAWDVTCFVEGVDWGQHGRVARQTTVPAGKALNVSRALAWLGQSSVVAGLWGRDDYPALLKELAPLRDSLDLRLTLADGGTRRNITVADTAAGREMHLRAESELAHAGSLRALKTDLQALVHQGGCVVFAGAMAGGELLDGCLAVLGAVRGQGARIVVDSSGVALRRAVEAGGLALIKPNLEELSELLGEPVADEPASIIPAARRLCDRVETVLVSRGGAGALAVTRNQAVESWIQPSGRRMVNTVGAGDYLLAGFLAAPESAGLAQRLAQAVRVGSARVWGMTQTIEWHAVQADMGVELKEW